MNSWSKKKSLRGIASQDQLHEFEDDAYHSRSLKEEIKRLKDRINCLEEENNQFKFGDCSGKQWNNILEESTRNYSGEQQRVSTMSKQSREENGRRILNVLVNVFDNLENKFNFVADPDFEYDVTEGNQSKGATSAIYLTTKDSETLEFKNYLIEIDHGQPADFGFSLYKKIPLTSKKLSCHIDLLNQAIQGDSPSCITKITGDVFYKDIVETGIKLCLDVEWNVEEDQFSKVNKFLPDNDMIDILNDMEALEDPIDATNESGFYSSRRNEDASYTVDLTQALDKKSGLHSPRQIDASYQSTHVNANLKKIVTDLETENENLKQKMNEIVRKLSTNNISKKYEQEISNLKQRINELQLKDEKKNLQDNFDHFDIKLKDDIHSSVAVNSGLKWCKGEVTCVSFADQTEGKSNYKFNILLGIRKNGYSELLLLDKKDPFTKDCPQSSSIFTSRFEGNIMDAHLGSSYHIVAVGDIGCDCSIQIIMGKQSSVILGASFKTWFLCGQKKIKIPKMGTILHVDNDFLYFVTQTEKVCYVDLQSKDLREVMLDVGPKGFKIQAISVTDDRLYAATEDGTIFKNDIGQGVKFEYEGNSMLITALTGFDEYVIFSTYGDDYKEGNEINLTIISEDMQRKLACLALDSMGNCIVKNLVIKAPRTIRKSYLIVSLPYNRADKLAISLFNTSKLTKVMTMESWWNPAYRITGICAMKENILVSGESQVNKANADDCYLSILKLFSGKLAVN